MCRSASIAAARALAARGRTVERGSAPCSPRCSATAPSTAAIAAAGGAHRLIFYGFMLLFAGTATITLEYDILEPLFGIRFWHGEFYLVFSLILDVAGRRTDRGARIHDVSARLDAAAEARLRAARPRAGRSGFQPAAISPRGLGIPLAAVDHRLHGLRAGSGQAGLAAGSRGRLGYPLVVPGGRAARGRHARAGPRRARAAACCAMACGGFTD